MIARFLQLHAGDEQIAELIYEFPLHCWKRRSGRWGCFSNPLSVLPVSRGRNYLQLKLVRRDRPNDKASTRL